MKKFGKSILVALMVMMLFGCSSKKDDKLGTDGKGGKTYNIGIAIYQFDDNFMTLYREETAKYFKEVGEKDGNTYKLDIQDGKKDQATQTEQIKNFIAQGKDLIIANMVDPTAAGAIINSAKEKDVPIVFINREPEPEELNVWPGKTTYVGADATKSGTIQGKMIAALPNKGDINGDGVVNYIMLQGDPGNVDAQQRTKFSIKGLEAEGVKTFALAEPYQANWDAAKGQEFTSSALEQFGDKLEVVFANNDGMAVGAVTAIEAKGRKVGEDIFVVGVDAIPDAIELLKGGRLTGTVLNDHFNQAHTAVDVALELLEGKNVSSYYWHDYVGVAKPEDAELKRADAVKETVEEVVKRYAERDKE